MRILRSIVFIIMLVFAVGSFTNRVFAELTVPTEGVYDTTKDTKNSSGYLTERNYYYKNKLVEKRTYTGTNTGTSCTLRNQYLYYEVVYYG